MYFFIFVGFKFNTYLNTKETQLQKTLIINTFSPILYCYLFITAKENYTKALQSINKTHVLKSDLNFSESLIFSTLYKNITLSYQTTLICSPVSLVVQNRVMMLHLANLFSTFDMNMPPNDNNIPCSTTVLLVASHTTFISIKLSSLNIILEVYNLTFLLVRFIQIYYFTSRHYLGLNPYFYNEDKYTETR